MSLVRASNDKACMEMVKRKRVSAYPIDLLVGQDMINNSPSLLEGLVNLNWAINKNYYYMIISKDHPRGRHIIERFNNGLKKLKTSGEWGDILRQHGIDEKHLQGLRQTPRILSVD